MQHIDLGTIEERARKAEHLFQELEERIETIEADGGDPSQSTAVGNTQSKLQGVLEDIISEAEYVSEISDSVTEETEWQPSGSAFEITFDDATGEVVVTANESVSDSPKITVNGETGVFGFSGRITSGDEARYDATGGDTITVEWQSEQVRSATLQLPNSANAPLSADSRANMPDPPSSSRRNATFTSRYDHTV